MRSLAGFNSGAHGKDCRYRCEIRCCSRFRRKQRGRNEGRCRSELNLVLADIDACDFIVAAETAKCGQPEINLGMLPGAGGTQRLTRRIGHGKAMGMCLTGRFIDAYEAKRAGLVARLVPADTLLAEAIKAVEAIANRSLPSVLLTKESIDSSQETPLAAGMRFERKMFYASFATQDQKEGTAAFFQKRPAAFKDC